MIICEYFSKEMDDLEMDVQASKSIINPSAFLSEIYSLSNN